MITAIEIENFKAFGERQRIEFRPITLLFGPNSGGKSSVTHALHYLREVLCERRLDAHRTWSGGDSLDLGGAKTFVHGRVLSNRISIKAEFALRGEELPVYEPDQNEKPERDFTEEDIRFAIKSAAVTIVIDPANSVRFARMDVELNGEKIGSLVYKEGVPHAEIQELNTNHHLLIRSDLENGPMEREIVNGPSKDSGLDVVDDEVGADDPDELIGEDPDDGFLDESVLDDIYSAALGVDRGCPSILLVSRPPGEVPSFVRMLQFEWPETASKDFIRYDQRAEFGKLVSLLILGPAAVLAKRLRPLRYVGPLRMLPNRTSSTPDHVGRSRWATGEAAWEELAKGSGDVLERVSTWLEQKEMLDTGYQLHCEVFKQIPVELLKMLEGEDGVERLEFVGKEMARVSSKSRVLLRDIERNLTVQPQDVGVGLSQVIPVLAAIFAPKTSLVVIEQPELHLHPRQQAALGDALIATVNKPLAPVLIIETHSEHLILRLLRRIRQTSSGEATAATELKSSQVSVAYVQSIEGRAKTTMLPITDDGDFVSRWPNGFFAERVEELL